MFNDVGNKIKTLAKVFFIIILIFAIIIAIVELILLRSVPLLWLIVLISIAFAVFFGWIGLALIYGYGELITSTIEAEKNTQELMRCLNPAHLQSKTSHSSPYKSSSPSPTYNMNMVKENTKPESVKTADPQIRQAVVMGDGSNTESLLKRAFIFLEDGEWDSANNYCETALDFDPENALAYLGKLMAAQHVSRRNDLENLDKPFDADGNYQKAIRFGDDALVSELEGYLNHIKTRNEKDRVTGIYNQASAGMKSATTESSYKYAAQLFQSISGFRDADELSKECFEKAESCRKDSIYASAKAKMELDRKENYEEAIRQLETIPEWNNADELISECRDKIDRIKAELLIQEETEKNKELEKKKAAKKKRIIIIIFAIALLACITLVVVNIINRSQLPEPAEPTPAPTTATTTAPTATTTSVPSPASSPIPTTDGKDSETVLPDEKSKRAQVLLDAGDIDGAAALVTEILTEKGYEHPITLSPTSEHNISLIRDPSSVVVIMVDELRIRKTPDTSGEIVGKTERGQYYEYYDIYQAGEYTWYRIDAGWIADGGGKYLSKVQRYYFDYSAYSELIEQAMRNAPTKTNPESFLGHAIEEVVDAFGEGFAIADFGSDAPYPGLYYEDGRTAYVFLYQDNYGTQTGTTPLYADYIVVEVGLYRDIETQARKNMIEWQLELISRGAYD